MNVGLGLGLKEKRLREDVTGKPLDYPWAREFWGDADDDSERDSQGS